MLQLLHRESWRAEEVMLTDGTNKQPKRPLLDPRVVSAIINLVTSLVILADHHWPF